VSLSGELLLNTPAIYTGPTLFLSVCWSVGLSVCLCLSLVLLFSLISQAQQPKRALKERKLSFREIQEIFSTLDKNGDGSITHAEFITGLKKHSWVAEKLGMPSNVRQEDGTRGM
jgi:hypothetical protein